MLNVLFANDAIWFTIPALLGTGFFLIRVLLMAFGAAGLDFHDGAHDAIDTNHHDATDAFKLLSVQSVVAFMMGFGWGGLAALQGTDWSMPVVIAAGAACGLVMAWTLGLLLRSMYNLQASGNVDIGSMVGRQAVVYLTVPPLGKGTGQITVVIDDKQRTINAVASGEEPLPTHSRVSILSANDDNTVTVVPA